LDLKWRGQAHAMFGDGNVQAFDVYAATVTWDGQPRTVEVDAADTDPLIGMGLIYRYDLRIHVVEGGTVTIEALR
jgi:predicted aspartyl protease